MRKTSNRSTLWILSLSILLCGSALSFGQNREKFVISAKAGGINAITGEAIVHAKGVTEWSQLMVTDDLNAGDMVRTASNGRIEILLNPGSYLRIGGNSEVELSNNSLDNLEVRLLRGTAIVEATGGDGTELNIGITTPHAKMAIVRQGLYRLNVIPGDTTELIVRKGRVILNDSHTKVKGGNKVVFSATAVSVAKLSKEEKKNQEDVETWSKSRAETLSKANKRISDRMLTSAFASFRDSGQSLFGFGSYLRSGLWFFNPGAGCYTFLPFFYGWGSPYGSLYSTSVYINPAITYGGSSNNSPSRNPIRGTTGGSGPSRSPVSGVSGGITRTSPTAAAPRDPDSGGRMRNTQMTIDRRRPN